MTIALTLDLYIKRPSFDTFNRLGTTFITKTMLREASFNDRIPPCPSIVNCYGCRVRGGRITGIVLERLDKILVYTKPNELGIPAFLAELQSTVDCL